VTIPEEIIDKAAGILTEHLESYGPHGKGIELVGGTKWWRVRFRELQAEWIEVSRIVHEFRTHTQMSKDYTRRTTATSSKIDKRRSLAHLMNTGRTRPVRDGSGAAVTGDRVILYIHGKHRLACHADTQVERTSSPHSTCIGTRSSGMRVKPVLARLCPTTASHHSTRSHAACSTRLQRISTSFSRPRASRPFPPWISS
jgi:hypothetical protein